MTVRGSLGDPYRPALQATLGTVLRVMGPERVLAAMPLNLEAAVADDDDDGEDDGEGWFTKGGSNLWLLGVMRANLCGSSLAFFTRHLLPLCKRMAAASSAAAAKGDALQAQRCATVEYQLWATLPAFCHWSLDTAEAFPALAKEVRVRANPNPRRGTSCGRRCRPSGAWTPPRRT